VTGYGLGQIGHRATIADLRTDEKASQSQRAFKFAAGRILRFWPELQDERQPIFTQRAGFAHRPLNILTDFLINAAHNG
jgi:hypothetical protein